MAEVSKRLFGIDGESVTLTMVYDDTKRDPDPEIDIDPCDLIRFDLVTDRDLVGEIYRGNSPNPWTLTVAPGSYSYDAGGPIRTVSDARRIWVGTV
jgi:hypothetical protein